MPCNLHARNTGEGSLFSLPRGECSVIWMEKVAGERGSFRPILGHSTPLLHAREWILRWIKMDISSAVEHSNPEAKATKMVAR
jgi:hypothetical protein